MKQFSVPENLLSAIGNYLVTRPYQEVANLIRGMESEIREIKNETPPDAGDVVASE